MINAIQTALSGLIASSKKIAAGASNIANMGTVGSLEDGGTPPYTPITTEQKTVTDGNGNALGVEATYRPKANPFVPAYDPNSPFANEEGIIGVPNVSLIEEIVNIKIASLEFRANLKVIQAARDLEDDLLRIFDRRV